MLVTWLMLVTACSTTDSNEDTRMVDAAVTPLSDLNLVQKKIPEILLEAQQAPYALPSSPDCMEILVDIRELGQALGIKAVDRSKTEGGDETEPAIAPDMNDVAVDALRRTAEGILPMRSWIRKLTGAERRSKEVSSAIYAGHVRRAFLRGYFVAVGCVERKEIQPTVKLPPAR